MTLRCFDVLQSYLHAQLSSSADRTSGVKVKAEPGPNAGEVAVNGDVPSCFVVGRLDYFCVRQVFDVERYVSSRGKHRLDDVRVVPTVEYFEIETIEEGLSQITVQITRDDVTVTSVVGLEQTP